MIRVATLAFIAIGNSSALAANAINKNMHAAASAVLSYVQQMNDKSRAAFQAIHNNALNAAAAVARIGQAAQQAASSVSALRSELESLPNINRSITYTVRTVGRAPTGFQTGGSNVYMEEGGSLTEPTSQRRLIVGETADEVITRTGLRSGKTTEFTAKNMKTITNLGMHEPEIVNVVPIQGYYAQRYRERAGRGAPLGIGTNTNPLISRMATGGSATSAGTTGYIKKGGWGANKDPRTWTVDRMNDNPNWWKVVDNRGRNVATNFISNQAAQRYIDKALGVDTNPEIDSYEPGVVLHGGWGASRNPADWRVTAMKDNPNLFKVVDRTGDNVATDFTSEAAAKAYIGSGAHWGGHDEGKVLHGGWGANQNPMSWRVVRMRDNPKLWKIVDSKGINVVTDFKSKDEAQAYINKRRGIKPPGQGGGTGGGKAPESTLQSNIMKCDDRIPLQDAVNSMVDNRRDPLYLEKLYGQVNAKPTANDPAYPPNIGGGGGTTGPDGIPPAQLVIINEIVQKLLRGLFGKLNMEFTGQIDKRSLWKINNAQLNDSLSRF